MAFPAGGSDCPQANEKSAVASFPSPASIVVAPLACVRGKVLRAPGRRGNQCRVAVLGQVPTAVGSAQLRRVVVPGRRRGRRARCNRRRFSPCHRPDCRRSSRSSSPRSSPRHCRARCKDPRGSARRRAPAGSAAANRPSGLRHRCACRRSWRGRWRSTGPHQNGVVVPARVTYSRSASESRR